jgi:hypothetical protein
MEVAEHLPRGSAESLVVLLTAIAPAILFSAALPGQGGLHHINEQPTRFWRALFEKRGFVYLDPVRRRVWQNPDVEPWYQQNMRMYVERSLINSSPALEEERRLAEHDFPDLYLNELIRVEIGRASPHEWLRRVVRTIRGKRALWLV